MPQIGIDCEDIETFRRRDVAGRERFYRRIFTEREMACCAKHPDPYPHLAARFAAKEAVIKALSPLRVFHRQVEVLNRNDGSPFVNLLLDAAPLPDGEILVSLSHSSLQAVACAWVEEPKEAS